MSISIISYPSESINSAFNPTEFTVATTQNAQPNIQISCDIKVGNITLAVLFARASGNTLFDISKPLSNYILSNSDGHDITTLGTPFNILSPVTQNGAVNYNLLFTEWFDVARVLTAGASLAVNSLGLPLIAINSVLQKNTFSPEKLTDFINTKFLTNAVRLKLKTDEEIDITFLTTESSLKIQRKEFIGETLINTTTSSAITINNNRGWIHTGMVGDRMEFTLLTNLDVPIGETIIIKKDNVNVEGNLRLEFKNRLGGMDAYTFRRAKIDIKTKQELINVSDIWKTLSLSATRTIIFKGKEETNDILTWLEELHTSKVVYLTDNITRLRVAIISSGDTVSDRAINKPQIKLKLSDPKLN